MQTDFYNYLQAEYKTIAEAHFRTNESISAFFRYYLIIMSMPVKAYDKAIIITSDGDFDNLVKKLITVGKLDMVLTPSKSGCSHLLSSAARGRIVFLDELIDEIEKY